MKTDTEILNLFAQIKAHRSATGPALHKPLLVLFMLARCLRGEPQFVSFAEIDRVLAELLRLFYPAGSEHFNTHYPFGKLENDEIWEVERSKELKRTSVGHLLRSQLLAEDIKGGFASEVYHHMVSDTDFILATADVVADTFLSSETKRLVFKQLGLPYAESAGQAQSRKKPYHSNPKSESSPGIIPDPQVADEGVSMASNDSFIAYLNSLNSLKASGANALAESQAVNPFFGDLYEPFPLADELKILLRDQVSRVVVLSGHAGDGKSTVALDVYKALHDLDPQAPLATPLRERESIDLAMGSVTIIKDMSELSAEQRQHWLREAFADGSGSWLIVSNTGPLLSSLRQYAKVLGRPEVEDDILGQLDQPLNANRLEEHVLDGFEKPLLILNLSRFDNTELGARLLGRMIKHPSWQICDDCSTQSACPINQNRRALRDFDELVEQRVRWLYRRISEYEQRLTLRQIVAQLALSLTGGMSCSSARTAVELGTKALAQIVFSEGFFGFQAGLPSSDALGLRAVELAHGMHCGGPVSPAYERLIQANASDEWVELPESLQQLAETWRKARKSPPKRAALRRLLLLFGRARPGREKESDSFNDALLRSPGLRRLDASRQQGGLALSRIEKGLLRNACLDVLREAFSGFTASQFDARNDDLYLTLRRPDHSVIQPTQLVVGSLPFRDFQLGYDPITRLPILAYRRGQRGLSVELPLSLPLLDYILRRADGELGTALEPIHQAQLDGFQANLLNLEDARSYQDGEITLLRADISGSVEVYSYLLDKDRDGKPKRLVKQR